MGKRNGKKNSKKRDASKSNNNNDKSNKRRVSFNLSPEHTHRHSYTSVANSNGSSYQQRAPTRQRQTRLQTLLLSGALILTLPKLLYRAAHVYCSKEIDKQHHNHFLQDKSICRITKAAIGRYERHVPYSHYLLGINGDKVNGENDPIPHQDTDHTLPRKDADVNKKGIFKRVVDRHRQQRVEKKKQQRSGELSHKQHPLHQLLEGASAFSHWKKQQQQQQRPQRTENKTIEVDWTKWKYAMSDDFQLTSQQTNLIQQLAKRVLIKAKLHISMSNPPPLENDTSNSNEVVVSAKSFQERVDSVPWGGVNSEVTKWWPRKKDKDVVLSQSEGARLLAAYLKIMKWPKVRT